MSRNRYFIPSPDRKLGDRYELLDCLGDGSYGWVWKAQRLEDDEIVAVKIPKAQGNRNSELAEGEHLCGQTPHPNVVSVYWMGRVPPEREWYAIEMEYFPSQTLARRLDEGDQGFTASYQRVLNIYAQVLAGVEYLHQLGMSHGDIKPQNILVSGDQAKLTDFGCSLLPEEIYVRTRENGGTILYSAPELAGATLKGKSFDSLVQGDIYSLGVLLYHLVTSRLPHDTLSQVIRHTPFPTPREINSSVAPALEDFMLRCLALAPYDRGTSVTEMLLAFNRVKHSQLEYHPVRMISPKQDPTQDWSSQAIDSIESGAYDRAETVASAEFERSRDPQAFLLTVSAAYKAGRYFDCLQEIENHPQMMDERSPVSHELHRLALNVYLETRQIYKAEEMLKWCLQREGESAELLLKHASILGTQSRYREAAAILMTLNRQYPQRSAILKRLALVFEQLRDPGKSIAFLRAYSKVVPNDRWAARKLESLTALEWR